jgi:hypothetical protein
MALRIRKATEPVIVERVNLCIYAQPGLGKTSMAFTAEHPLLLDFDIGAHRAANRGDSVKVGSWADVENINAEDVAPYHTIVIDTAGRALDSLAVDIIRKNPKAGNGGALSLKGFGELKVRFAAFLRLMNSFGKDVVLICHMDEQRNGDDVIERLDAQGSSKGEIYKSVDAMGRIFVRNGKRYLDFNPREGSFGKNPAQLPELEFPMPSSSPHFLADTVALIKSKLNELTEEQKKQQDESEEWMAAIRDLSDLEDFNRLLNEIKHAPTAVKSAFHKAAEEQGFAFNKAAKCYEAKHVAA